MPGLDLFDALAREPELKPEPEVTAPAVITKSEHKWAFLEKLTADTRFSRGELAVAISILNHVNYATGDAWPSLPTIAKRSGLAERSVRRSIARLENFSIVARAGRQGRSNHYTLLSAVPTPDIAVSGVALSENSTDPGHSCVPHPGHSYVQGTPDIAVSPNTFTDPFSVSEKGEVEVSGRDGAVAKAPAPLAVAKEGSEDGFAKFWLAYPRQEFRAEALAAYRVAVAEGASETLLATKAQQYAAAVGHKDTRYQKTPHKWLSEKRWLENPQPPKPKKSPAERGDKHSGRPASHGVTETAKAKAPAESIRPEANKEERKPITFAPQQKSLPVYPVGTYVYDDHEDREASGTILARLTGYRYRIEYEPGIVRGWVTLDQDARCVWLSAKAGAPPDLINELRRGQYVQHPRHGRGYVLGGTNAVGYDALFEDEDGRETTVGGIARTEINPVPPPDRD